MKNFYTNTLLIAIFLLCSNPINAYIKVDGICYNTEENSKTVYNNSSLNITKGTTSNGNVAYYANVVINKNDDIIEDFVFRCALCAIRTTIQQSHFTSAVTAPSSFRRNSTLPFEGNCNMVTPSVAAFTTSKAFSAAKRLTRNTVSQFTGAPA